MLTLKSINKFSEFSNSSILIFAFFAVRAAIRNIDDNIVAISESSKNGSKNPFKKVSSFFVDCSSNSSVHGVDYLLECTLQMAEFFISKSASH